tara:strand:- start:50 stop:784 length:735 start_codon:yes stop_codon:yes gene_type:complete
MKVSKTKLNKIIHEEISSVLKNEGILDKIKSKLPGGKAREAKKIQKITAKIFLSFIEYATEEENFEKFLEVNLMNKAGIDPVLVMHQVDNDWMENPFSPYDHLELWIPRDELKNVIEKNLQSSHWSKISQVLSHEVERDFTMLLKKLAKDKFREMWSAKKAKADEEDERYRVQKSKSDKEGRDERYRDRKKAYYCETGKMLTDAAEERMERGEGWDYRSHNSGPTGTYYPGKYCENDKKRFVKA